MNKYIALLALALSACATRGTQDIISLSEDTYMISRTDKGGIFGNASEMKMGVIEDANRFADSQGKVAIALRTAEQPMLVGRQFASFEYQFKLVDKGSKEARGTFIDRIQPIQRIDIKQKTENADQVGEKKLDTYAELLKLDDLHKRGILSQDEFDQQKRKLLSQ